MLDVCGACNEVMQRYRLSEWDVHSLYSHPDGRSTFALGDGVVLTVAEKALGRRRFVAIVRHRTKLENPLLRAVLRIPNSIPAHEDPTQTLSALCDAYGVPLGDAGAKLLIEDEIVIGEPVTASRVHALFQLPTNHRQISILTFVKVARGRIKVRFGFCIDETELLKDV